MVPKWSQIVPKWSQKVPKWSQMGPLWLPKDVQSDPGAWEGTFKTPHVFDKRETRSRLAKNTHVFECRARFDPRPPSVLASLLAPLVSPNNPEAEYTSLRAIQRHIVAKRLLQGRRGLVDREWSGPQRLYRSLPMRA